MIFVPKHLRVHECVHELFFRPVHEYVFWVSTPHVQYVFFPLIFSCPIFPVCTLPTPITFLKVSLLQLIILQ